MICDPLESAEHCAKMLLSDLREAYSGAPGVVSLVLLPMIAIAGDMVERILALQLAMMNEQQVK